MQDFARLVQIFFVHKFVKLITGLLLLTLITFLSYPNSEQMSAHSNQTDHAPMPINTLIELNAQTPAEMEIAIAFIEELGGDVPLSFAPRILFAQVPDDINTNSWVDQVGIIAAYTDEAAILSRDPHDQLAARVWNDWQVNHPFACCEKPDSWLQSYLIRFSDRAWAKNTNDSSGMMAGNTSLGQMAPSSLNQWGNRSPDFYLTSLFYMGDYQVDLMLPESIGDDENWSRARRDEVVNGVASGILWWVAASQKRTGRPIDLSYNVTVHDPFITPDDVRTSYEPIQTNSQFGVSPDFEGDTEGDWIGQLMRNMEEPGELLQPSIPVHYVAMWDYIDKRRNEMNRDWGFIVFVADSLNDEDGMFQITEKNPQPFAYAGRPGPHVVLTYDNGPNSGQIGVVNGMKINMAHEMGHIIGALEEYYYNCDSDDVAGYFQVENTNCENGIGPFEDSIMRIPENQRIAFPSISLSTSIRQMAGWRDSDGDGLLDPVDTTPMIRIDRIQRDETGATFTYQGLARDIPFHVPSTWSRPPMTINTIEDVEYQLDGGEWEPCLPIDLDLDTPNEHFDSTYENFNCEVAVPEDDIEHTVAFRSLNSVGSYSDIVSYPMTRAEVGNMPPTGSVKLVGGNQNTLSPTIHLALSAADDGGVADYRLFCNGEWQAWKTRNSSTGQGGYQEYLYLHLLNDGKQRRNQPVCYSEDQIYNLGIQYRDRNGDTSEEIFMEPILLDMEPPTGSLNVEFLQRAMDDMPQVHMFMNVIDEPPSEVNLFYNDQWSGWRSFAPELPLTIAADGVYNFKAQYKDLAGNLSRIYSDTLTVDMTAPHSQVDSPNGSIEILNPRVSWSGTDNLSGIKCYDVQYSTNRGQDWTNWQDCTTDIEAELVGVEDGIYQLRSRAVDNYGNEESYPEVADVVIEFPASTPTPTSTLTPTSTPIPTSTPTATSRPTPTFTLTPIPTSTFVPTSTMTAIPTDAPTDTPMPTDTVVPTETSELTDVTTDVPTVTLAATLTPVSTATSIPSATETSVPALIGTPTSEVDGKETIEHQIFLPLVDR